MLVVIVVVKLIPILALLANMALGGDAFAVLCFGADGHVEFERLGEDHPVINDAVHEIGGTAHELTGAHLAGAPGALHPPGPCFDVALVGGWLWQDPAGHSPGTTDLLTSSDASAERPMVASAETRACDTASLPEPSDYRPMLACLASTILRI